MMMTKLHNWPKKSMKLMVPAGPPTIFCPMDTTEPGSDASEPITARAPFGVSSFEGQHLEAPNSPN